MERKDFLRTLGAGAAFAITFPCLGGCSKDDENDGNIVDPPTNVDFTIDLSASEAAKLSDNGGFIRKNLVVIVRNLEGNFVAASQVCSHEQYDAVVFDSRNGGTFFCDVHGSRFGQDGTPLNTIPNSTPRALKVYNTELNGNLLRVFE
ncbi:ubiquinol-cytochrome c reductase iron-sulfur subunit [Maribacter chungangensis]|uniref:Ubiquinol-cytochrome c reductase iron-sulfur subunit n=1 Tax=Maribacter chungangensis TaxID=1069117 RepID=A0ABW3B1L8_9FLAO